MRVTRPPAAAPLTLAPLNTKFAACPAPRRAGSNAQAAGGNTPKLDFRAAELRGLFRQDQVTGQRQFETTAQTLSADRSNGRCRCFRDSPQQPMKLRKRHRNLLRQMLLNTRPKTEIGAFASEHDGFEVPPIREAIEGRLQIGHHRLINDIGLGGGKNDARYLTFVFKFHTDFHKHSVFRGACRLRRPGGNFLD